MTAEEYFRSKNGGKSPKEMTEDGELISPIWASRLMKEFARQKCKEQRVRTLHNFLSGYAEGEGKFSSVGTESWRTLNQKQIAKIILDESTEPEME